MIFKTTSEEETNKVAADFCATLNPGDIILLRGDLGMGKSVFSRAVIRNLTENQDLEVPSPTFTLVQTYETKKADIWHFDLYRLKDPEELYEIGWEEALTSGIILVEWPDRLGHLCPRNPTLVNITQGNSPSERIIEITR